MDDGTVWLLRRVPWRYSVSNEDDALYVRRESLDAGVVENRVNARKLGWRCSREKLVKGQHCMGLAAAEVGLQLDHWIAAVTRKALYSIFEKPFQAFR